MNLHSSLTPVMAPCAVVHQLDLLLKIQLYQQQLQQHKQQAREETGCGLCYQHRISLASVLLKLGQLVSRQVCVHLLSHKVKMHALAHDPGLMPQRK